METVFFDAKFYYTVCIPQQPTFEEEYAANLLKKYSDAVTDGKISIIRENLLTEPKNSIVYLGKTKKTIEKFSSEIDKLGTDDFCIKFSDGNIYLFDKSDIYSRAGIIYASCEFVERFLGVRFFSYDEELVPKKNKVLIETTDIYERPDFIMRQHLASATRKYPDYAVKMRIKDCFCPDTPGGALYPLWAKGKMWHNLFDLIPPDKYKDKHPEWFDMESGQLCFTNEELTDEIVNVLKPIIESNPDSKFFTLSQNDTDKPCQCEKCKESYEKYTVTGTIIRFVNRVAVKIKEWLKKEHPERENVYITTFAYYFSVEPPVKKTDCGFVPIDESVIPCDNVYIFFTTIDNCFYHYHDDATCEWNKSFVDRINGWKSLVGERFIFWTYTSNYSHYFYPFFNFHTVAHNFKLLKNMGGRYILDQASCESEYVNFSELRTYVNCKLLWNVNADVDLLMNEFIDGYYKVTAPYIKSYISVMKEKLDYLSKEKGYHLRVFALPESMFDFSSFPLEFLTQLDEIFDKGFEALKNANEPFDGKVSLRFRRVRLYAKYLYVINYDKYFPNVDKEEKVKFIDEFINECKFCGMNRYKESLKDNMDEFRQKAIDGELLKY